MYVNALASEVPDERILLEQSLENLDLERKVATTSSGQEISFEYVISSAPFDRLLDIATVEHDQSAFTYNKVLCFNLGFDKKGPEDVHWIYLPEKKYCFYRVGFYDNILDDDRMSLYVEIGYGKDAEVDRAAMKEQVLADLQTAGIVEDHQLEAWHSVVLDPAYVHITQDSKADFEHYSSMLELRGVHSIGRYGGWTYCSIEDNIVEAKTLAEKFNALGA
jgi:protoporphyrinogen oxidase